MKQKKDGTAFCPEGKLCIERAQDLREQLRHHIDTTEELVLDLSGVTSMDLSFIQLLIALQKEAEMKGRKLSLEGIIQPNVRQVFLLAGCGEVLQNIES